VRVGSHCVPSRPQWQDPGRASLLLGDVTLAVIFKKVSPSPEGGEGGRGGFFWLSQREQVSRALGTQTPRIRREIGYLRRGQAARLRRSPGAPPERGGTEAGGGASEQNQCHLPTRWDWVSFKNRRPVLPAGHVGGTDSGLQGGKRTVSRP